MDGQNDEGDRVDDGGRVADVEAKGWGDMRRAGGETIVRSDNSGSSVSSWLKWRRSGGVNR
jgi:hypothetical protein